jgi:allantoinase
METLYDYGARSGFWRLHRLFTKRKMPVTVFAVGMALERNPVVCHALREQPDWEVASHGYRWIDYQNVDEETEREHIARCITIHERVLGKRPVGFYQGKVSPFFVSSEDVANPHLILVSCVPDTSLHRFLGLSRTKTLAN